MVAVATRMATHVTCHQKWRIPAYALACRCADSTSSTCGYIGALILDRLKVILLCQDKIADLAVSLFIKQNSSSQAYTTSLIEVSCSETTLYN